MDVLDRPDALTGGTHLGLHVPQVDADTAFVFLVVGDVAH